MNDVVLVALYAALYALAIFGALSLFAQVPKATAAHRAKRHDALMARIVKLEIANGYTPDYSADWLRAQGPDWVSGKSYLCIAVLRCRGCGTQFERDGDRLEGLVLCRRCRAAARWQ